MISTKYRFGCEFPWRPAADSWKVILSDGINFSGFRIQSSDFRSGGPDRFHQNRIRQFLADAQSRVANLANEIRLMAQKLDDLFLAKAQFTQAVAHFRGTGQFLDANHRAGFDFAERANGCPGAFAVHHHASLPFRLFAHCGPK
jgi:hypothetical protein